MFDLSNPFLRKGIRVALVVSVLFYVLQSVAQWPGGSLSGAFASFSMLALADFGGPRWHRFSAYVLLGVSGVILVALGSFVSQWRWPSVVLTAVIIFAIAYAAVLRGYFASATAAAILPWVYAVTAPYEPAGIMARSMGWAVGSLVAAIAAITVLPTYTRSDLRIRLAEMLEAGAQAISSMDSAERFRAKADELRMKVRSLRGSFRGRLARPGGVTRRDRAMMLAVDESARLAITLTWTDLDPSQLGPIDRHLMAAAEQTLNDCARALRTGDIVPDPVALNVAREQSTEHIELWCQTKFTEGSAAEIRAGVEASAHVRVACLSAQAMAVYVRGAMDPVRTLRKQVRTENAVTLDSVTLRGRQFLQDPKRVSAVDMLRDQLTFSSPWLQTALRTTVALTATVLIVMLLGAQHGFWLSLGALVALKFDASGTLRTARQVLIGTIAGFVVGLAFLAITVDRQWLMWILLPIVAFLAAYTPSAVSLIVGQASFTIFVIDLVGITTPDRLLVAEWRLADVVLGISISLVVSLLMWPHGVVPMVLRTARHAVRVSTVYMLASYEQLTDGALWDQRVRGLKRRSLATTSRAAETFDLAYSQRGPGLTDTSALIATMNAATQLNHSAEIVASLAHIYPLPESMEATGDAILAAAHRVSVRIVSAVDALDADDPLVRSGGHDVRHGSLGRLRRTLDADLIKIQDSATCAADGYCGAARAAMAASFAIVWIAQSVWMADVLWSLVEEEQAAPAT